MYWLSFANFYKIILTCAVYLLKHVTNAEQELQVKT